MAQTANRTLLDAALPIMNDLSRAIGQSCHLAVLSGDQVVVVARIESPRDLGFSVRDRKSTRLNSSHVAISYAVFCLKKKRTTSPHRRTIAIREPARETQIH